MKLRLSVRRAANRPTAWITATVVVIAIGLLGWQWIGDVHVSHRTISLRAATPSVSPLLDRNAECQPTDSPSVGGPGDQTGDALQRPYVLTP